MILRSLSPILALCLLHSQVFAETYRERDLSGTSLAGADLQRADFTDANLDTANLSGANLRSAQGQRTLFRGTNLSGADMSNTTFRGAQFQRANARNAIFRRADLREASFAGADVSGADFSKANVSGADFRGTKIAGANFKGARRNDALFDGAGPDSAPAAATAAPIHEPVRIAATPEPAAPRAKAKPELGERVTASETRADESAAEEASERGEKRSWVGSIGRALRPFGKRNKSSDESPRKDVTRAPKTQQTSPETAAVPRPGPGGSTRAPHTPPANAPVKSATQRPVPAAQTTPEDRKLGKAPILVTAVAVDKANLPVLALRIELFDVERSKVVAVEKTNKDGTVRFKERAGRTYIVRPVADKGKNLDFLPAEISLKLEAAGANAKFGVRLIPGADPARWTDR